MVDGLEGGYEIWEGGWRFILMLYMETELTYPCNLTIGIRQYEKMSSASWGWILRSNSRGVRISGWPLGYNSVEAMVLDAILRYKVP